MEGVPWGPETTSDASLFSDAVMKNGSEDFDFFLDIRRRKI